MLQIVSRMLKDKHKRTAMVVLYIPALVTLLLLGTHINSVRCWSGEGLVKVDWCVDIVRLIV